MQHVHWVNNPVPPGLTPQRGETPASQEPEYGKNSCKKDQNEYCPSISPLFSLFLQVGTLTTAARPPLPLVLQTAAAPPAARESAEAARAPRAWNRPGSGSRSWKSSRRHKRVGVANSWDGRHGCRRTRSIHLKELNDRNE